jgi:hypothetical protein
MLNIERGAVQVGSSEKTELNKVSLSLIYSLEGRGKDGLKQS